jgi:hypothetical protein
LEFEWVTIAAAYLGALDKMEWGTEEEELGGNRPEAWFVDAAVSIAEDWTLAVRYEGSTEFKPDEMPEHQGGAAIFWQVNSFALLGAEFLYGTFGGEETDERSLATVRLALEF